MADGLGTPGPAASPWPVVGRDEELDLLFGAIEGDPGRTVIVLGAAGVGKTRLVREAARGLEQRGHAVRWVVGIPSVTLPFGALATYLPSDVGGDEPATLVGHAVRALAAPSPSGRPLVVVDDAHLLDHASALVVSQLMHSSEVDVICAWRTGEAAPDLDWALRDETSLVLELQPLSPADVSTLLDSVLGPPVAPSTSLIMYRHSGGSGLFLRELVEDAHNADALTRAEDGWVLSPSWRPGARVMELVTQRIGRRTDPERVVLEALALSEPVGLDLLASIAEEDALVALERAQLIEVRSDGLRAEVRFAHPLYGEAVRSRLGLAAARQRKRALADALAATGLRRGGDLLTLARWRLEGGGDLDAEQWATAARQAIAIDAPEAEMITRRAVDAGAGAVAWAALGLLRAKARDLDGAQAAFEAGAAVAEDDDERVFVAVGHARALFWVADQSKAALQPLDAASERVAPGEAQLPLAIQRVSVLINAGRLTEGLAEIEAVLAMPNLPIEVRLEAINLRAIGLAFGGCTAEARETATGLLREGLEVGGAHPELLAAAAAPSLVVGLVSGELIATTALVDQFRAGARGAEAVGYLAALEGRLLLMQGRMRTALSRFREGHQSLALTMGRARSTWVEALIDETTAHLGVPADATTEAELDPGGDLAHRFLVVDALRARAVASARRGDLPRARALVSDAMQMSKDAGMLATEIWTAYEGFRLADTAFAASLAELSGRMAGPVGELFPRHAAAYLADDPNELEATALALADAGFTLCASTCAAHASRSFGRAGVSGGATRCSALARRLLERCEGARADDLVGLIDVAELTPRERDVVLLASQGLSNRAIADRTCTSLRTVEGHLLRAYRKLGISSRAELTAHFQDF
jgi:DNA-binding CsgD family transcriptional regulator